MRLLYSVTLYSALVESDLQLIQAVTLGVVQRTNEMR